MPSFGRFLLGAVSGLPVGFICFAGLGGLFDQLGWHHPVSSGGPCGYGDLGHVVLMFGIAALSPLASGCAAVARQFAKPIAFTAGIATVMWIWPALAWNDGLLYLVFAAITWSTAALVGGAVVHLIPIEARTQGGKVEE